MLYWHVGMLHHDSHHTSIVDMSSCRQAMLLDYVLLQLAVTLYDPVLNHQGCYWRKHAKKDTVYVLLNHTKRTLSIYDSML